MSGVSKVVYGGRTLVDLTGDTVSADSLTEGATAHAADGSEVTGGVHVWTRMGTDERGDTRPYWVVGGDS